MNEKALSSWKKSLARPSRCRSAILARRQRQVGDIINMQGDWALKEWYPNYRPPVKDAKSNDAKDVKDGKEEPAEAEVSA